MPWFKNFVNMCLKIYEICLARFFTSFGLVWQAALKKAKVKLGLSVDIDMLLMVQNYIWGRIYHAIYWYIKANNWYMKSCDKNKESLYFENWDVNDLWRVGNASGFTFSWH